MEARALNLNSGGLAWAAAKTQRRAAPAPAVAVARHLHSTFSGGDDGVAGALGIRFSMDRRSGDSSIVVRAAGRRKKNDEDPFPSGDGNQSVPGGESDGADGVNPGHDESKLDESTYKSRYTLLDWRDFRANLVAQEQVRLLDSDAPTQDLASPKPSPPLGLKWAHPISSLENGCVLVATEKLDGVRSFERTVVLLLRVGSRDMKEGPFGIVINRPMIKKIKHMKPSNSYLTTTFANCPLHSGGPLDISMFLLKARENPLVHDFEQVVPGICFGAWNNLAEAAVLVKKGVARPLDFRFFIGYAGWELDQLREEIKLGYWHVAACSSHLIFGTSENSAPGLWEEILQLMGGQYSELSRRPKHDSS